MIFPLLLLFICALVLGGCQDSEASPSPIPVIATATPQATPSPLIIFPRPNTDSLVTPSTGAPLPQPAQSPLIPLPENVKVLLLAGQDQPSPFIGRTDALMLILYDPAQAQAGVVSLPPDLLVTIPGFGSGRLNNAYSLGDIQLVLDTLRYNLGVVVDQYAVVNTDTFVKFIDRLGGILVRLEDPLMRKCPGITLGTRLISGDQALCVTKLREGLDEIARHQRQGIILQAIFNTMVSNGNLVRLPVLLDVYMDSIDTNLTRSDLLANIPLALRMGDAGRFRIYTLLKSDLFELVFSGDPAASYMETSPGAYQSLIQQAALEVSSPRPFTEYLPTLEYALTVSPTPTTRPSATPTITPTRTGTPTQTLTPSNTPTITPGVTWGP